MITALYGGFLGLLFFFISLETIKARGAQNISLGVGDNNQIIHLVSAHNNFASYTPIFIILMYFLELHKVSDYLLHTIFIIFLIGRVLHFLTMKNKEQTFKKRKLAMHLTLWPLILSSCLNLIFYVILVEEDVSMGAKQLATKID